MNNHVQMQNSPPNEKKNTGVVIPKGKDKLKKAKNTIEMKQKQKTSQIWIRKDLMSMFKHSDGPNSVWVPKSSLH